MAFDLMTLVAKITADTSDAEKNVSKFQGMFGKAGKYIAGIAKAYIGIQGVRALASFGKQCIQTGMEFDAAISQVEATMGQFAHQSVVYNGVTMDAIDAVREKSEELGRTTQFTSKQAADGFNVLAMAGIQADEAIKMLPEVMSLAAAGGMDIAESADYITGIMAGFGEKAGDAKQVADYLATMASSAKGDVRSFGEGLSTVAGQASSTGQSMKDMAIALEILGNHNVSASEAGNALNRTLKNLYQSSKSQKVLAELGVSAYDASNKARPLNEVLIDLNNAMAGWDDKKKNAYLAQIFDAATMRTIPFLLNDVNTSWGEFDKQLEASAGNASEMMRAMNDNLKGDLVFFGSAMDGFKIAIYNKFEPAMRSFVQIGTQAFSALAEVVKNPKILMDAIQKVLPNGIFKSLQIIGSKVEGFVLLMKKVVGGLLSFLQQLWNATGDSIMTLVEMLFGGLLSFIQGRMTEINDFIRNALDVISEFWNSHGESILNFISTAVAKIVGIVSSLVSIIVGIIQQLNDTIMSIIEPLLAWIMEIWNTYGEDFLATVGTVITNILDIVRADLDILKKYIDIVIGAISTNIKSVMDNVKAFWDTWGSTILSITTTIWNNIKIAISTVIDVIKNMIQLGVNVISGNWKGAWNNVKNIFTSVWNGIKSFISNVLNGIKTTFSNVLGAVWSIVGEKFESIRSKIKEKIDAAKEAVDSAIQKIKGFFNFSWSLPKLKLPHVSITGSFSLVPPSTPKFSVDWYRKAYDNIVEFANPTVIPTLSGLKGFGDGAGSELVMSKSAFFDAIESARGDTQVVFNIYTQKGQSEEEIARQVEKWFVYWDGQKRSAFV